MKLFVVASLLLACVAATPVLPLPRSLLAKLNNPILNKPQPGGVDIDTYLIAGEAAKAHSAPYLVSLSLSKLVYTHTCGGVVIGKDWVLTAAHCLTELQSGETNSVIGLPVYAGLHDRSLWQEAQVRFIDFAFAHKKFNGKEGSADIALLHVSQPFAFNARVKQIALPSLQEDFTGVNTATYGWGLNDTDEISYVKDLQVAKALVLNKKECSDILPDDAPVGDNQICVNSAACYGDGGSPVVVEREGDIYELVAIISWGYVPCGYNSRPTVCTSVSQYIDWIAEVQWAYYILH